MGATGAMMALAGTNTLGQFMAQRQEAGAVLSSGAYHRRIAEWNARLAENGAEATRQRGRLAESRHRMATRQLIGEQRAALAAQGIDVDRDSAAAIQDEAATMGELDALTLRNNAAREAWGYEVQATDALHRARMVDVATRNQAAAIRAASAGTLLTGATQLYDLYRGRNVKSKGTSVPTGTPVPWDYVGPERA